MSNLSGGEMIALITLLVALAACIAAWLVVPELRQWLRLGESPSSKVSNANQGGFNLSWPDAINEAVEDFRKLHPYDEIEIDQRNTEGKVAIVYVKVFDAKTNVFDRIVHHDRYKLTVDKAGTLLEIKQEKSREDFL